MNKKILFNISRAVSYIFVPPVMNLFIFIIFSINFEVSQSKFISIVISFLFGFLIPILTFLEFRKRGKIINDDATIKEERTLPYIFAIVFSLTGVVLSSSFGLNPNIIMLWMVYLMSSIFITNINRYWKISAHTMGVGMPMGAIIFLNNEYLLIITGIILIFVALSRLYLKVHDFTQVLAGAIIGIALSFGLLEYCL